MPLTEKGEEIHANMKKTYGSEKKADEVFFASKNKGTISGVDEILSWAGGEHLITPGGDKDTPIPPDAKKCMAVTDSGEFGMAAATMLGRNVTPRVLGTSSYSDPIAVVVAPDSRVTDEENLIAEGS